MSEAKVEEGGGATSSEGKEGSNPPPAAAVKEEEGDDAVMDDASDAVEAGARPAAPVANANANASGAPSEANAKAKVEHVSNDKNNAATEGPSGKKDGSDQDVAPAEASSPPKGGEGVEGKSDAPNPAPGPTADSDGAAAAKKSAAASPGGAAAEAGEGDAAPSFSMTLAIGPADTTRVFAASRAFNVELKKLQQQQGDSGAGASEQSTAGEGAGEGPSGRDRKRKPAIVHSPHGMKRGLEASTVAAPPPAGGEAATHAPASNNATAPKSPGGPRPLRALLVPAAQRTVDPLIASFLSRMDHRHVTAEERQAGLLFFLDADKSTKLLAAFDVLSAPSGEEKDKGGNEGKDGKTAAADDSASKLVKREGLVRMFQSFLAAISTCVHGDKDGQGKNKGGGQEEEAAQSPKGQGSSPGVAMDGSSGKKKGGTGDWKGSDQTQREIREVANFAADHLVEYARKEAAQAAGGGTDAAKAVDDAKVDEGVSFDVFGKWYNSGGFSLVPWLELLDLSKWDYAGSKDATAASASTTASQSSTSSSSKRARLADVAPFTPGAKDMNEAIGSPTELFAAGASLVATPQTATKPSPESNGDGGGVQSFSAMFGEMDDSRTVVSFDFSGSAPDKPASDGSGGASSAFHIDITEENLVMLRSLVQRTGFSSLQPRQAEALLLRHARCERRRDGEAVYVISRAQFGKFVREAVPKEASRRFDPAEIENFSNYFTNFFTCFDYSWSELKKDEVNAKELMVGFSFLFAGNKSSKLAAAYEMLDVERNGYLTQQGLMRYLRSYLTMLAGISLLSANKKTTTQIRKRLMSSRRDDAFLAVENGARWTLSHFIRAHEARHSHQRGSTRGNAITFEDFARWYTEGGYAVAPWLELLDLQKFLSLIGDGGGKYLEANDPTLGEVLFTFPLTNDRNLIVLRDDAQYVKTVVNELGLLSLTSEDIWRVLFNDIAKILAGGKSNQKKSVRMEVDQPTFVQAMMRILSGTGKMKQQSSWNDLSPEETLKNFFLSFDLSESKKVPLNQLMCGLTLLCGGKKSNKLVFAFGLFGQDDSGKNGKKKAYLTHKDFFFFFRSFLIVMFSCCNQSLSLDAEQVTRYISDTAKSVADDVMKYWKAKKVEKVKFENFSEWYNEGGFETAPWLELLDLNKWVLADDKPALQQQQSQQQGVPPTTPAPKPAAAASHTPGLTPGHEAIKALLASPKVKANGASPGDCPPAPPDDDPLFDLDMSAVDAHVDEMDFILQQEAAPAPGNVESVNYVDPASTGTKQTPGKAVAEPQNALKFNILTHDQFGGYMISIGPDQVQMLHRIVTETALCQIDPPAICKFILNDAKSRRNTDLSKRAFQSAMKRMFDHAVKSAPSPVSKSTQAELSKFTEKLFTSFDRSKTGKINAVELACGFTALCHGRKSDKLEHVFELLDEDKDSLVSREEMTRFIQSFLVVLMSVSSSFTHLYGGACSNDSAAISKAIESGSQWATTQVFEALQPKSGMICFDDFADWYTKGGYQSMPWLELLDLRKWVIQGS